MEDDDGSEWVRSRPVCVQAMMRRFPPSCTVRAKPGVVYFCPAPGKTAKIVSYVEDDDGCVYVTCTPDDLDETYWHTRYTCDPDDLEVVGYWGHVTPEWVAAALTGSEA